MFELNDVLWYGAWLGGALWLFVEQYRRQPSLEELARRARHRAR